MDRMSAQDAAFLYLEDANNPMHLGSVAIFEGPPPSYGELVRHVSRRIALVPRYRQMVHFVPLGLGRPVWADDPHFQVLYHLRHTALPRPGDTEQLRNLAGRVFAQNLDRSKPLWELWLVEGMRDDRWALIAKVHHCMVDGISTVDLLAALMDLEARSASTAEVHWNPSPAPSRVHLAALAIADGLVTPFDLIPSLPQQRAPALEAARQTLGAWQAMLDTVLRGQRTVSSLNAPLGPHRRWSWVTSSLDDVRTIRRELGGTVNDVVLAAVTSGFRHLLTRRREDLTDRVVRALVPVSVRKPDEHGALSNRVAGFLPDLPVGEADPLVRLTDIREQMDEMKQASTAQAGDTLTQLSGYLPPLMLEALVGLARSVPQRTVNTITTNVPGPQQPLYLVGRQLLEAYPYVPIGANIVFGTAVFSYLGRLSFGITADYDAGADLEHLATGISEGIAELLSLARPATVHAEGHNGKRNGRRRPAHAPSRSV